MKVTNIFLVAACAALLLTACAASPEPTEPAKTEPAESQPTAAAEPAEPAKMEPVPAEPPVPEPAKAEPAKPAAPKNEPKPATPKETTLSSGLKMIDSKEGQGEAVKTGNVIQVHYTGWLYENGKRGAKFDSSVERGPFEFTVGQGVIRGWSEGVVGMKPGGRRELIIPPALGYGAGGAGGGVIPPNATLDFEIEMLKILR
jgi:peptidylprolyl isomerase